MRSKAISKFMSAKMRFLMCLLFIGFASAPHAIAANFTLVVDDNFNRANTSVGSGANSTTGIGNGWVDFRGNIYSIVGNVLTTAGAGAGAGGGTDPNFSGLNGFYYNSGGSASYLNGMARVSATYLNGSQRPGAIARFNPASSGTGYSVFIFSQSVYFTKMVNGVESTLQARLVPGVPTLPTSIILEMIVTDISSSTTQITANIYDQSNPTALLGSINYLDSSSPIQTSGYWGGSRFVSDQIQRVTLYSFTAASMMEAAPVYTNFSTSTPFKTSARQDSSAPYGGVAPYSYQWLRSTSPSSGFANVGSATGLYLNDTGLTPGTTYYYRLDITDSSTTPQTITSTTTSVTTIGSSGHIIGFLGDSITNGSNSGFGTDLANSTGARIATLNLRSAGYDVGFINRGIGGATAYSLRPGGNDYAAALAAFQDAGVDTVSVMLGTNEARLYRDSNGANASTTPDYYQQTLKNLVDGLLSPGTGITRVIMNYPPYLNEGSASGIATSTIALLAYQQKINQVVASTSGAYLGDTTIHSRTQSNLSYIADGVHLSQAGHSILGSVWAQGYVANFEKPSNISATPSQNSATITWDTNAAASSRVTYGISSAYAATSTDNNLVTSHSRSLSGLLPCAQYHFAVSGSDAGGYSATSSNQSFVTTGCSGSASVSSTTAATITTGAGGTLTFDTASLTVPVSYSGTTTSAVFQAKLLDADEFHGAAQSPSGKVSAGEVVLNLQAFITATTTLPTFSQPLTITMSYTSEDISSIEEASLKIHRYDGNVWHDLTCSPVDTGANTVTCQTFSFSDFALFGNAVSVPSPSSGGSAGNSGSSVRNRVAPQPAVAATTTPTVQPQSIPSSFTRPLAVGDSGADVKALQIFLNARGFAIAVSGPGSAGSETNVFGELTRLALAKFQASQGIYPAVGNFGPLTMAAVSRISGLATAPSPVAPVLSFTRDLGFGDDHPEVKLLQQYLNSHGFPIVAAGPGSAGNETTKFGNLTRDALVKFQVAKGISPAVGFFGPVTRAYFVSH